ncbi:hypothetical protein F5Y16DRAFT_395190 [Xylariaceae sp. FL0255]|nr:hypothetical protein F5Y16DRAFT_395190 [Xylariaceae sp. FL0255]
MSATQYTTGIMGMWNGTNDGHEDGYVDWSSGKTNINNPQEVDITVQDIRTANPEPMFETEGYGLVNHETSLTPEQFLAGNTPEGKKYIEDVYFKECAELIKEVTGSNDVLPYAFRVREQNMRPGQFSTKSLSSTVALPLAHVDRDDVTGEKSMHTLLGGRAKEVLKNGSRYAQVNVWRGIGEPIARWPLCFVNKSQIPDWKYKTHTARVFPKNDPRVAHRGEKLYDSVLKYDPRYEYHYVSSLDVNEAVVFSSFDSDVSKVTPHGAFWDESTAEDAPIRRSIEVRCWVVFDH